MLLPTFRTHFLPGTDAIVVCVDLQGFSQFFSQPDAHLYVPAYLNVFFNSLNEVFRSGWPSWLPPTPNIAAPEGLRQPDFVKFMGDGALYIWTSPQHESFSEDFRAHLMAAFFLYRYNFATVVARARVVAPLAYLPSAVRIGVSRGMVYGLMPEDGTAPIDYVGSCINLAARLQTYCRSLGVIVSARVALRPSALQDFKWRTVCASKIRGLGPELVYVDTLDFEQLTTEEKAQFVEGA